MDALSCSRCAERSGTVWLRAEIWPITLMMSGERRRNVLQALWHGGCGGDEQKMTSWTRATTNDSRKFSG
eukprot:1939095-Rhodomonas_salina.2